MARRANRSAGAFVCAVAVALLTCSVAMAAPAPPPTGVSVTPVPGDRYASTSGTHLELGMVRLGVAVNDRVRVLNIGPDPLTVELYAADATPAVNGGFGFTPANATPHDVGAWITLAAHRLRLPGHSSSLVPFRLVVPTAGVPGGEHVGGIVAEPVSTSASGGVQTKTRFAMAVYLTVPGQPRPAPNTPNGASPPKTVTVTKLDVPTHGRTVCPKLTYRNDTALILDPSAQVTVRSSWRLGTRRETVSRVGAVLPGATAVVGLPCLSAAPGPNSVTVTLRTPQGAQTVAHDVFVTPWLWFLAALFLLLLLLLIALELWRRRRARARELARLHAADAPLPGGLAADGHAGTAEDGPTKAAPRAGAQPAGPAEPDDRADPLDRLRRFPRE